MNSMVRAVCVAAALAVVGMTEQSAAAGRPDLVQASLDGGRPYVLGEMLVQFRYGASARDKAAALQQVGGQRLERIAGRGADLERVRLPAAVTMAAAVRVLEAQPAVEFAEPNWIYAHSATSNDPYYTGGQLWGMYGDLTTPANQYGSQAGEAWAAGRTCNDTVYVGVIDEGYMYTHEDLAANAWTNPFDAVDGVDNDSNGYVDDTHGWDFDGGDNTVFDGTQDDHGTHVSGTIAGAGGNGIGVAGVCWTARLISGKFLGRFGGTTANAIKAVDYMTDLKLRHGLNLVATNNSWGGGGYSQALKDAIERANNAGILFVAAAGNDTNDNDANPSYPASYDNANIIAVASITSTGGLSSFSNYGASSVDLGAPGSGIYSTLPKSVKGKIVSGYGSYSGTSMATPHVTGAALLYASTHAGATHLQIRDAILSSTIPTASLTGKCATGGRLNVGGF